MATESSQLTKCPRDNPNGHTKFYQTRIPLPEPMLIEEV
jgi:hypothetical protein